MGLGLGNSLRARRWVRAAMLGDKSSPNVFPSGFALTSRRNISPDPVAISNTCIPFSIPECCIAQACAFEWKKNVLAG